MFAEVDGLLGVIQGHTLGDRILYRGDHVFHINDQLLQLPFPLLNAAVSWNRLVPVEFVHRFQHRNPLRGVSISHEGNTAGEQVARGDYLLLGQINDYVASGMTFPKIVDVDGPVRLVQDEAAVEGQRGERDLDLLWLLKVALQRSK